MTLSRIRAPIFLFLVGLVATYLSLSALWSIRAAHADTAPAVVEAGPGTPVVIAPAAAPAPAITAADAPTSNTMIVLMVVAIALGALSTALHIIAPRTANTWDDSLRDKVDELLAIVRGGVPAPPTFPAQPRAEQGKVGPPSGILPLLAVFLIGLSAASQVACSTWRDHTAAGVGAFLSCEAPHVDTALLDEAKSVTIAAVQKWISGDGHVDTTGLRSAAAPLKSDLMRCAFDAAIAALATPTAKQPGAPQAATFEVQGDELRAAAASVRAQLGWPAQVTGG